MNLLTVIVDLIKNLFKFVYFQYNYNLDILLFFLLSELNKNLKNYVAFFQIEPVS